MKLEDVHAGQRVQLVVGVTLVPECSRIGEVVGFRLSRRGKTRVLFLPDWTEGDSGHHPVDCADIEPAGSNP